MMVETQVDVMEAPVERHRIRSILAMAFSDPKSAVGVVLFSVFVFIAIFAGWLTPYNPYSTNFSMLQAPTWAHPLGTTYTGQDVLSQFILGARTSILIGFLAGSISTILSMVVGMTAGYVGGWVDNVLNLLTNVFLVMPSLALLLVIESLLKQTTPVENGIIIGMTGWAFGARIFRAMTLTLKRRDFIVAASLSQASSIRILLTEIAPNMVSVIAANVMYASLGGILAEAGLAYLGLESMQKVSWGTMLFWANGGNAVISGAWWWFVPPGLGIALVGLSLVLMNFAVDRITNPRLRTQRRRRRAEP